MRAVKVSSRSSVMVAGTHPAIPSGKRAATKFWGFVSGVTIIAGIVYAFFGGWYWAPVGVVVGFAIEAANRRSAQQFIAETAAQDIDFRIEMKMAGILLDDKPASS